MKTNFLQNSEDMFFTVCNNEGEEVKCELLLTFEDSTTGKNYIVYTDNTEDEEGNTRVYANQFDPNGNASSLLPIEDERMWTVIEEMLTEMQEECTADDKSEEELKAELEDLINELSEMLPQHKDAFASILTDPESVDYAGLRDSILNDMDDCSEGS